MARSEVQRDSYALPYLADNERGKATRRLLELRWPDGLPDGSRLAVQMTADRYTYTRGTIDGVIQLLEQVSTGLPAGETVHMKVGAVREGAARENAGIGVRDILVLPSLWVDVDLAGGAHASLTLPTLEEWHGARTFLEEMGLAPSLEVRSSPGGRHVEWLLEDAEEEEPAAVCDVMWRLQVAVRGALRMASSDDRNRDLDSTSVESQGLTAVGMGNPKRKYVEANGGVVPIATFDSEPSGRRYSLGEIERLLDDVQTALGPLYDAAAAVQKSRPSMWASRSGGRYAAGEVSAPVEMLGAEMGLTRKRLPNGAAVLEVCPSCGGGSSNQRGTAHVSARLWLKCKRESCEAGGDGLPFYTWGSELPHEFRSALSRAIFLEGAGEAASIQSTPDTESTPDELRARVAESVQKAMRGAGRIALVGAPTGGGKTRQIVAETLRDDPHGRTRVVAFLDSAKMDEALEARRAMDPAAPDPVIVKGVKNACVNPLVIEQKAWGIARGSVCSKRRVPDGEDFAVGCDHFRACAATVVPSAGSVVFTTHASALKYLARSVAAGDGGKAEDVWIRGAVVLFDEVPEPILSTTATRDELEVAARVRTDSTGAFARWLLEVLEIFHKRHVTEIYPPHLADVRLEKFLVSASGGEELLKVANHIMGMLRDYPRIDPRRFFVERAYTAETLPASQELEAIAAAMGRFLQERLAIVFGKVERDPFESDEEFADRLAKEDRRNRRLHESIARGGELSLTADGLTSRRMSRVLHRPTDQLVIASADVRTWNARFIASYSPREGEPADVVDVKESALRELRAKIDLEEIPRREGGLRVLSYPHARTGRYDILSEHTGELRYQTADRSGAPRIAQRVSAAVRSARAAVLEREGVRSWASVAGAAGFLTMRDARVQLFDCGDDRKPTDLPQDPAATRELARALTGVSLEAEGHLFRDDIGSNKFEGCRLLVVAGGLAGNLGAETLDAEFLGMDVEEYRQGRKAERIGQCVGRLRAEWQDDLAVVLGVGVRLGAEVLEQVGPRTVEDQVDALVACGTPVAPAVLEEDMRRFREGVDLERLVYARRTAGETLAAVEGAEMPGASKRTLTGIRKALEAADGWRRVDVRLGGRQATPAWVPPGWTDADAARWADGVRRGGCPFSVADEVEGGRN